MRFSSFRHHGFLRVGPRWLGLMLSSFSLFVLRHHRGLRRSLQRELGEGFVLPVVASRRSLDSAVVVGTLVVHGVLGDPEMDSDHHDVLYVIDPWLDKLSYSEPVHPR